MDVEAQLLNNDFEAFKHNEDVLHKAIDTNKFYEVLDDIYGYDFEKISTYIQGGEYTFHEQQQFNIIIRRMKKEQGISIQDTIIYLENDMLLPRVLKFIDDATERVLRDELEDKYEIKVEKSKISRFLVDKLR